MPKKSGRFTHQESVFVGRYVATGDKIAAAKAAGYANPHVGACKALQRPAVLAEIARIQEERVVNELLPLAVDCLASIMKNEKAPAGARVSAAKVVLDRALGSDEARTKELHEMTREDIDEAIARLQREAAERARPVLEVSAAPASSDLFE